MLNINKSKTSFKQNTIIPICYILYKSAFDKYINIMIVSLIIMFRYFLCYIIIYIYFDFKQNYVLFINNF